MNKESLKIRQLTRELELLQSLARPFIEANVYSPNKSQTTSTIRTINLKAKHLMNLKNYFDIKVDHAWRPKDYEQG